MRRENRLLAAGAAALAGALVLNYLAGSYVDRIAVGFAPAYDSVFELLPFRDLPLVHVYGFGVFLAVFAWACRRHETRERVAYFLLAYGMIVALRALFNTLTPLGIPAQAPGFGHYPLQGVVRFFDFRYTMFFSGHTAFPFLGFLLLRGRPERWICLAVSLTLGTSVLLSRLHYSIDVGAAFFFAYAVRGLAADAFRALGGDPG